jgi:hypothetical protein
MQQIAKCHEFLVYVVVENVETLDFWWCVCLCGGVPRWAAGSLPRLFRRFGRVCI